MKHDIETLRRLMDYDPKTGVMRWRARTAQDFTDGKSHDADRKARIWNGQHAGKTIGCDNGEGYLSTNIDRKTYKVHHLAFAFANGRWPANQVDHIDGNRSNNSADNLRDVSASENARNTKRHRSGKAGIVWYKPLSKWRSQIWHNGKNVCLGYFDCWADALAARRAGEASVWGR